MEAPLDDPLYFEDLTPGRRFGSATMTVDEVAIRRFASEFNPSPSSSTTRIAPPWWW